MAAGLDQYSDCLGIGIDVDENLETGLSPTLEPAFELADIAVTQGGQAVRSLGNQALAGIIKDDRHGLAGQPCLSFEGDSSRGQVGGKQRVAGCESRLMAQVEQRDFL